MSERASVSTTLVTLGTLSTLAITGSITVLAIQFYRDPFETKNAVVRAGLLLTGVREHLCHAGGLPIHFYQAGRQGKPIVFLHGLGGRAENWGLLLPLLRNRCRLYALDLPGFGRTPLAPEGVSIATYVVYLRRFLDELGLPQVSLVGNSMGGWIAARFALAYPERVEHLYLLNSAGLKHDVTEEARSTFVFDREAARATLHYQGIHLPFSLPMPNFILDAMVRHTHRPAYAAFIKNYDPAEALDDVLAHIKTPTTIIWGERDTLIARSCAEDLHKGITNSQLIYIPQAGHAPQSDAPRAVARSILRTL